MVFKFLCTIHNLYFIGRKQYKVVCCRLYWYKAVNCRHLLYKVASFQAPFINAVNSTKSLNIVTIGTKSVNVGTISTKPTMYDVLSLFLSSQRQHQNISYSFQYR
mgnify:CR=1 FL=1